MVLNAVYYLLNKYIGSQGSYPVILYLKTSVENYVIVVHICTELMVAVLMVWFLVHYYSLDCFFNGVEPYNLQMNQRSLISSIIVIF